MKKNHVCIFTSAHPIADVRVYSRVARSLLDAEYAVSWVGPDRQLFGARDVGDRRIEYHFFRNNNTKIKRIFATRAAKKVGRRHISDVDWWYCPDPDAAATAEHLSRRLGGKVVFDIHEVFDKGVIDRWFGGTAPRFVKWLVRQRVGHICKNADIVTGVNDTVLEGYTSRTGKVVVTRLCAPRFFSDQCELNLDRTAGVLKIIHGKAIEGVGTEQVLDALRLLCADVRARIAVTMIRMPGTERSASAAFKECLRGLSADRSVVLQDSMPHAEMPALLSHHTVGMISCQRDFGIVALPNRLFEYMAAGMAIMAPSYSKEIVPIVEKEKIGLLVDFEKPAEIAEALGWLVSHPTEVAAMGQRARQAFLTTYNWDKEFAKLLKAMQEVELSAVARR